MHVVSSFKENKPKYAHFSIGLDAFKPSIPNNREKDSDQVVVVSRMRKLGSQLLQR